MAIEFRGNAPARIAIMDEGDQCPAGFRYLGLAWRELNPATGTYSINKYQCEEIQQAGPTPVPSADALLAAHAATIPAGTTQLTNVGPVAGTLVPEPVGSRELAGPEAPLMASLSLNPGSTFGGSSYLSSGSPLGTSRFSSGGWVTRDDFLGATIESARQKCAEYGVPDLICDLGAQAAADWVNDKLGGGSSTGGGSMAGGSGLLGGNLFSAFQQSPVIQSLQAGSGLVARDPVINQGQCPEGFVFDPDSGQCIVPGATGAIQRTLPGGQTGTMPVGAATTGAMGIPAIVPQVVGQRQRAGGGGLVYSPILQCPRGMVLGKDSLCYVKGSIPRSWRKWPPGPKPPVSAADAKAIRKADSAKKKVKRLAGKVGFSCKTRGSR